MLVVALFSLASTRSQFTGDGYEYAKEIAGSPGPSDPALLEPGHLLWRPLGALLTPAGADTLGAAAATRVVQRRLSWASRAGAAVAVLAFGVLAASLVGTTVAALGTTALFALGAAFITFAHAPTSYLMGLTWLTVGLALAWRRGLGNGVVLACAGLALGLGALFWLPYALVLPGALLGIALTTHPLKRGVARAAVVGVVAGVVLFGALAWGAQRSGVRGLRATSAWIRSTSHGIERPGVTRAAVGMVRLFAEVGDGPRLVKRYQARDPYNPVRRSDLLVLWLWPATILLAVGGAATLWRSSAVPIGRSALAAAVVALIPVLLLAIAWSGSELERFLPVYPFFMALVAVAAQPQPGTGGRSVAREVMLPLGLVALANLWLLSVVADRAHAGTQARRLGCLTDVLTDRDLILVPDLADPLRQFSESHLDDPPRTSATRVLTFLPKRPWHGRNYHWESALWSIADSTLAAGGRVFVPAYVRSATPPPEANWIEGEVNSVPWREVVAAYGALEMRTPCAPSGMMEVARVTGREADSARKESR